MKRVLVTGSGGFIFSNFLRKATYEKHPFTFVSVDNITKTNVLNNIYANKNHKFYVGDIADDHFVKVLFEIEKPDIVIHGAAETFVDDSIIDPYKFIRANVLGTQTITSACIRNKVDRLIYISTDEVYGHLTDDKAPAWNEEAPLAPRNPYSVSKASGELIVKAAHETYGLTYNITRSSNNYGPRQSTEKLIPKIIKNILNGQKIPIYGQGQQIRDWTHVFDNCGALLTVLSNGKDNETYNIAANQEFSNLEVVNEVCKVMEKGHDLITFVTDRPGHDFRYSIDSTKLKNLGWQPAVKFRAGIAQTVEWYLNNQWFLNLNN